jgi:hypothetical protein
MSADAEIDAGLPQADAEASTQVTDAAPQTAKRGRPRMYTPEEYAERERDRKRASRERAKGETAAAPRAEDAKVDAPVAKADKPAAARKGGSKEKVGKLASHMARVPGKSMEIGLFGAELVPGRTVTIRRGDASATIHVPAEIAETRKILDAALEEVCADLEITPGWLLVGAAVIHAVNMGILYQKCAATLAAAQPQGTAAEVETAPQGAPDAVTSADARQVVMPGIL